MNLILFDNNTSGLKPLVLTRPAADLRVGILTIKEKWEKQLKGEASFLTEMPLSAKFPVVYAQDQLYINGKLLPNSALTNAIQQLKEGEALSQAGELLALRSSSDLDLDALNNWATGQDYSQHVDLVNSCPDLFSLNDQEIRADFELLTAGRTSAKAHPSSTVIGDELFIEEGAQVLAATINCSEGPVYIGKNALVMEGSLVRGPFALCESATVKMGAKIYGATTVGPQCKVGGEVNNVVFHGYSNKGHDGFLGNSVIGEWCNIGADTNSSNLKNNYAEVKIWNYDTGRFSPTGLQFCGLIMGDHSKCGINTMFNTGTVVGVSANIFGSGFPRNFVPSFSWGGSHGFSTYTVKKAFETAERVMERRGIGLTDTDKSILTHIFESSSDYRVWDKK